MRRTLDGTLDAMSAELISTGLLDGAELRQLLRHAAGFPDLPHHRLFLEYRLHSGLRLEGYGHGYDKWVLLSLLEARESFAAAKQLTATVAEDPFAEDRMRYLDLEGDSDPDWVEYDHADGSFADAPGVFFSFPARFRNPATGARLRELEATLGALIPRHRDRPTRDEMCFWDFLKKLVIQEKARGRKIGLYRLGLCRSRQPGWVRIVLNGLSRDSLDALGKELFRQFQPDPIGWIVEHLAEDDKGGVPTIAGSVTVINGIVEALDLECPYFHKIADPDNRRAKATAFCRLLSQRGLVSPSVAETLARASVASFGAADGPVQARLFLNHFKCGVGGATLGRVKAYFELLLRTET